MNIYKNYKLEWRRNDENNSKLSKQIMKGIVS